MSCVTTNPCGVLKVDPNTAKIFITIANAGCGCANLCLCGQGLSSENTWIFIRRDGPKYSPAFGCCGNPAHRVFNCPILPGQLSYPYPTFIVPCPDPVAPPFFDGPPYWYYKYPPFVQYKLFSKSGNELCFYLDSIFYNVPKGRYVADLFVNEQHCQSLQLKYDKGCRIVSSRAQQFNQAPCLDMNPSRQCPTADCT